MNLSNSTRKEAPVTHGGDWVGKPVSEEEAAIGLGFKDVHEMRRWQTDLGHKVVELEFALNKAKQEAERFRWHGRRQQLVLKKIDDLLRELQAGNEPSPKYLESLRLAIGVVCGGGVDWENELKDWFVSDELGPLNEQS